MRSWDGVLDVRRMKSTAGEEIKLPCVTSVEILAACSECLQRHVVCYMEDYTGLILRLLSCFVRDIGSGFMCSVYVCMHTADRWFINSHHGNFTQACRSGDERTASSSLHLPLRSKHATQTVSYRISPTLSDSSLHLTHLSELHDIFIGPTC